MNDLVEKIQEYERKVQHHREKKAKLQGKAESSLQRVQQAGFDSIEEAEEFIAKEEHRLEQVEAEFTNDVKEFEALYADYLEEEAD